MIDLSPDHLKTVERILAEHVPDCEVRAFGSRVTWTAKDYSDLDLAVVGDRSLDLDTLRLLREAFEESDLPFRVDVIDRHAVSESFRKVIEAKYEVIQRGKMKKGSGCGGEWVTATVAALQNAKVLLVEDGNHGEYRPRPDEFVETGVAFIRAADIEAGRVLFHSASKISQKARNRITKGIGAPGDVLLTHKGTVGKTALVDINAPPFVCSPQTTFWRTLDQERLDRAYLYAFMRSSEFHAQLATRAGETDMAPYVSLTSQRGLSVTLPPIATQRAIAHILCPLDDKIELNRRMNETLEAMARALFKSWFVDFDPVRAKMEGRWRKGESLPGLPAHLYDLFPSRLVGSEIGEIPEGWKAGDLSMLASLNAETWTRDTRPTVINYVDLSNTKWGRVEVVVTYDIEDAPSRAQRVLRPLDTIVGTVRPGNGSYAFVFDEGLTGSTAFAVLRPSSNEYAEFIYLAATADNNIQTLSQLADGGAYPAVRPEMVSSTGVTIPGNKLIGEFSRYTGPLMGGTAEHGRESRTLAAIRDSLLPKLISGKLRVKDAQRFIERLV